MRNIFRFGVILWGLVAAVSAQAPIQITTRLVQVAVVVRDKRGAVADLTKNDFEILDKGKARRIATFSVARSSDSGKSMPLPPNTFSNRLDQRGDPPVVATVILFDRLNTSFENQSRAREQVLAFLKSIDPKSPTAIYALGNNLRILHDFTEDRARLARALEGYRTGTSTLLDNSAAATPVTAPITSEPAPAPGAITGNIVPPSLSSDMLAQIMEPLQSFALDRRVAITLEAMQSIANRMAGVPGRKNLIWISGGFPLTMSFEKGGLSNPRFTTYAADMKEAAASIDRANVAIYPVDARGLLVNDTARQEMPALINQTQGKTSNMPTTEYMTGSREIETMQLLADWTGGKAYYNQNDIRGAIQRATEDAEVTYTLGFYADSADSADLDGAYHELKVKVARKGAEARYRKGYFATALTAVGTQPAANVLRNAVLSPADSTGLNLTASLAPKPDQPGSFILAIGIDLQNISLSQKEARWSDDLNFVIAQMGSSGSVLDSVGNALHFNVSDENRQKLLKEGIILRVGITPAPGLSQIRVALMDGATGNVGSLRIIPPQAK